MGYNLNEIREDFIGVRGKGKERVDLYNNDIRKSYGEMYRILKPNKYAVIVIGNATYQGEEVKTVEFTIDYNKVSEFLEIKAEDNKFLKIDGHLLQPHPHR